VLNLRKKVEVNVCGGIHLEGNTFSKNAGCSGTHGAIYAYCYSDDETRFPGTYHSSTDSYSQDTSSAYSWVSGTVAVGNGSQYAFTYRQEQIVVDQTWLRMTDNLIKNNLAGKTSSIVELVAFPQVQLS